MVKIETKRPAGAFDYEASEKFENMVEALLNVYEKDGRQREGFKGLANILLRKLRSADKKSIVHSHELERIMRGVSRAIDHPEDLHYMVDNIQRGVDCLKNWAPEETSGGE